MSVTTSTCSPSVSTSILGDCETYSLSVDPVVRWLDRLIHVYDLFFLPQNEERIPLHDFDPHMYMMMDLRDLLAWGEALVSLSNPTHRFPCI